MRNTGGTAKRKLLADVQAAADVMRLRKAATAALAIALALSLATTGLAQNNATTTIAGTAHDFSDLDTYPWMNDGTGNPWVNHCEVCHGPPPMGSAAPDWKHWVNSDPAAYDGANWTYAIGDSGMVASDLTEKCMGCHEGAANTLDDFTGGPPTPAEEITGTEAFGTGLAVHHPVDITYDAALAIAQGALEDPTLFLNPQGGGTIAETLLIGGKLACTSCHEQHNDRRFDLVGGDPTDDPAGWKYPGPTFDPVDSENHNFLRLEWLCFVCHTHDQPHDGTQHHIPGRVDPFGDLRSSDMACSLCHDVDGPRDETAHIPPCKNCHIDVQRGTPWTQTPTGGGLQRAEPGTATTILTGHHGGDRETPYFDCAMCHADPLTGIVTGNWFGIDWAPSCYKCHDDLWNEDGNTPPAGLSVEGAVDHDNDSNTPDRVYGTVGEALTLTAVVATNTENDPLAYQWNFGDGSTPPFPSHDPTITHTYEDYYYEGHDSKIFHASVSVTDGVNPPIYYQFDVVISPPEEEPAADTWDVDTGNNDLSNFVKDFGVTIENHAGSLVVVRDDGQLAYGIEFVGVIFWMELWMDLSENVFWGTGDMYFGNIDRDAGTMSGVLFRDDGTMDVFCANSTAGGP